VVVATGQDNAPARALYERAGFTVVDRAEVEPGLWVTRYAR
jgi:ribosomal protein S18 acetylase RimI-like enzyme